jgi:hypothetical protein
MALPTSIRLEWKALQGTNILCDYIPVNYSRKKFYNIWPWTNKLCRNKFYENAC